MSLEVGLGCFQDLLQEQKEHECKMARQIYFNDVIAVDTQFKQLRKRSLKKIQASAGFEPVTSAIPVQCSTN